MAVVAVGDFDKAAMQAMIEKHFAALPRATKPRPRPSFDVPKQPGTLFAVATDPGSADDAGHRLQQDGVPRSVHRRRLSQQIVERLFGSMLSRASRGDSRRSRTRRS